MLAEVVGLEGTTVRLTAFGDTRGIEVGTEVVASGQTLQVGVGESLLGRVIDAAWKSRRRKGGACLRNVLSRFGERARPNETKADNAPHYHRNPLD